jgi:hypothetical protein
MGKQMANVRPGPAGCRIGAEMDVASAARESAGDHRGRAETACSCRESGPWIAGLDLPGR